jgi:ring-1,2-phenylacetyl-CoA epoxidase subunit PaaD
VDVLERAVADVPDPEVPVVTIEDLGILRAVEADEATGRVRVTITPTYSGCPAMAVIERGIVHAAGECGWAAEVATVLSPPWTTDWVSERGREAMRRFGIAPPGAAEPRVLAGAPSATPGPVMVAIGRREVACPQCGSTDTEELSRFGSTSCKALRRCLSCAEPFEEFKAI